jgi:hypothetical protein
VRKATAMTKPVTATLVKKAQRLPVYCAGADLNTEWAALTKYHISIVTSPTNHMSQGEAACDGIDAGQ